ncbi:hypothetical protein FB192DRAFT_1325657 [Mucor lusitanicus]|uniref:Reverse transcriptase zinc-binding domain-containing protein n=1 Tax=Mucor circinelloides f. lusitanicus TaxID=29924 RepID=A0A8H4BGQ9_MUCCL|nr:hypothetical protein FB192DRAFT_1325657 [Mucor lusitanicus]
MPWRLTTSPTPTFPHFQLSSPLSQRYLYHQNPTIFVLRLQHASIKYFKCLLTSTSSSPSSSCLSPSQWGQFWKLEIALNARNTWYLILLNKISTKELLHLRMSTKFEPYCTICPSHNSIETTEHFLFACSLKFMIWSQALNTYIDPHLLSPTYEHFQDLLHLRSSLTVSPSTPHPHLTTYQVFACILQAIWSCHYRSIFDSFPFDVPNVMTCIAKAISTLASQDSLHSFI